MFLTHPDGSEVALCYSMNVHPGEGMDDVLDALREYVLPLRDRLGQAGIPTFEADVRYTYRYLIDRGLRFTNPSAKSLVRR